MAMPPSNHPPGFTERFQAADTTATHATINHNLGDKALDESLALARRAGLKRLCGTHNARRDGVAVRCSAGRPGNWINARRCRNNGLRPTTRSGGQTMAAASSPATASAGAGTGSLGWLGMCERASILGGYPVLRSGAGHAIPVCASRSQTRRRRQNRRRASDHRGFLGRRH